MNSLFLTASWVFFVSFCCGVPTVLQLCFTIIMQTGNDIFNQFNHLHCFRMLSSLSLAVFLLLATSSAPVTHRPCLCSATLPGELKVNCSALSLMELPPLPSQTTDLYVQDNRLTSVTPGHFDRLASLRKVSLSGNPFHCDCRIQYLRNWLLKNGAIVLKEPVCVSPSSVAQRAIRELTDDYFSSCVLESCTGVADNILMGVMLCCLIALLLWSYRLARRSTFILYIFERHAGLQANSLRSMKPKHRRRLYTAQSEVSADSDSFHYKEDEERPLINMELKVKATWGTSLSATVELLYCQVTERGGKRVLSQYKEFFLFATTFIYYCTYGAVTIWVTF